MMKCKITYSFLFSLIFLLVSCGGENTSSTTKNTSSVKSVAKDTPTPKVGLVNPALKYCSDNGHKLVPVKEGSIVRYYLCINESAHKKCSASAYYRGDCSL